MGKKKWYLPPKSEPKPLTVSQEVRAELMKLADEMVAAKEAANYDTWLMLSLLALKDMGFGPKRLNRYLGHLQEESERLAGMEDAPGYADMWKNILAAEGITAFAGRLAERNGNDDG